MKNLNIYFLNLVLFFVLDHKNRWIIQESHADTVKAAVLTYTGQIPNSSQPAADSIKFFTKEFIAIESVVTIAGKSTPQKTVIEKKTKKMQTQISINGQNQCMEMPSSLNAQGPVTVKKIAGEGSPRYQISTVKEDQSVTITEIEIIAGSETTVIKSLMKKNDGQIVHAQLSFETCLKWSLPNNCGELLVLGDVQQEINFKELQGNISELKNINTFLPVEIKINNVVFQKLKKAELKNMEASQFSLKSDCQKMGSFSSFLPQTSQAPQTNFPGIPKTGQKLDQKMNLDQIKQLMNKLPKQ